ncbi:MAG: hypothetical protein K8T89_19650 [Planctomycetes bacterium]|nr:hypothetical protein [Planctomycetota bacterium]
MRKTKVESWVVYRKSLTVHGKELGSNAVCEQSDWDEMELSRPGFHTLLQSGIQNEAEAEKLARGTSGDPPKRESKLKVATKPIETEE